MTKKKLIPNLPSFFAVISIKIYRYCISPLLPCSCRYAPTCSEYSIEAIQIHGFIKGSLLSIRRICRCTPLGSHGFDPVPKDINNNCNKIMCKNND